MKDWTYNELNHVGIDYSKQDNVAEYDTQMDSFRDYEKEVKDFLSRIDRSNPNELTVVDIGCGTGAFSIHAAKYFKKIYAVDVSREMLKAASSKARAHNIENIEFINSGFLQFQPNEEVDIIHTKWAFHHLPDYWKQVGLLHMNKMLKPNGVLYIFDVVFRFHHANEVSIDALIDEVSTKFSKEFLEETKIHIREEYSTFDWILRGLIERAGFEIEESNTEDCLASDFLCRKIKPLDELFAPSV